MKILEYASRVVIPIEFLLLVNTLKKIPTPSYFRSGIDLANFFTIPENWKVVGNKIISNSNTTYEFHASGDCLKNNCSVTVRKQNTTKPIILDLKRNKNNRLECFIRN